MTAPDLSPQVIQLKLAEPTAGNKPRALIVFATESVADADVGNVRMTPAPNPAPPSLRFQMQAQGEGISIDFIEQARVFYDTQAGELVRAMLASLPRGTIDALLVQLLDHRRSVYRVAETQPPKRHESESAALRAVEQFLESRTSLIQTMIASVVPGNSTAIARFMEDVRALAKYARAVSS